MPVQNSDVSDIFNKMADLLGIEGANPFRVRAYRDAARVISGLPRNVSDMIKSEKDLAELPGIGKDLAGKIKEIAESGSLAQLEGFGKKTEQAILEHVEDTEGKEERIKLIEAEQRARSFVKYLKKAKGIKEITVAGSYRRRKETVGDLDILVTCKKRG
jgi:DNA polymerase (family 10)